MHSRLLFAARKTAAALWVMAGISVIAFMLTALAPGDPALLILGAEGNVEPTPAEVRETRIYLGLDRPLHHQYGEWALNLLQGNLGRSFVTGEPVFLEFSRRLPVTLALAAAAVTLAIVFGLGLGLLSASAQNRIPDRTAQLTGVALISLPDFWLGLILIRVFAEALNWVPTSGVNSPASFILPALVLSTGTCGNLFRLSRTLLLTEAGKAYITTARSKGITEFRILTRHALGNSIIPVMTAAGLGFGHMLGGAVIVESIFALPGIGQLAMTAISHRDTPVIQAYVVYAAALFISVNLLLDLAYLIFHPGAAVKEAAK